MYGNAKPGNENLLSDSEREHWASSPMCSMLMHNMRVVKQFAERILPICSASFDGGGGYATLSDSGSEHMKSKNDFTMKMGYTRRILVKNDEACHDEPKAYLSQQSVAQLYLWSSFVRFDVRTKGSIRSPSDCCTLYLLAASACLAINKKKKRKTSDLLNKCLPCDLLAVAVRSALLPPITKSRIRSLELYAFSLISVWFFRCNCCCWCCKMSRSRSWKWLASARRSCSFADRISAAVAAAELESDEPAA